MAHGLNSVLKRGVASVNCKTEGKAIGSRRIFAPHFKLQVLDSYRNDADCKGNQRATARKYGIHRRQIQKWLQAENTLRNSVTSAKEKAECVYSEREPCEFDAVTLNDNRQRDVVVVDPFANGVEARVPALTQSPSTAPHVPPTPLDFSTHGRGCYNARLDSPPRSPLDPAAPIDLSFKRPSSLNVSSAPVCCYSPLTPPLPSPPQQQQPHPDVWDLSTKNLKRKCPSPSSSASPKPVKLFKPYLDDISELGAANSVKLEPPCCSSAVSCCETIYYNNNNNNNVCDIVKSEYSNTYTLHELQPTSPVNYYYYPPYPGDYECANYCYEDISYGQNLAPLKQRQSYSLDFKLSAIDCYYQDTVCKGNQRAVASKYNIHRRQVQKWLKQAEELRLRNETMKQMHAVR